MNKFNKSQLIFTIGFIVLFGNPNFDICIAQNSSDSLIKNITTDSILQRFMEERINTINEYNSLYYKKEKLNDSMTRMIIEAPLIANKALAGQFIILRIDEYGERIPLTIADKDKKNGTNKGCSEV